MEMTESLKNARQTLLEDFQTLLLRMSRDENLEVLRLNSSYHFKVLDNLFSYRKDSVFSDFGYSRLFLTVEVLRKELKVLKQSGFHKTESNYRYLKQYMETLKVALGYVGMAIEDLEMALCLEGVD